MHRYAIICDLLGANETSPLTKSEFDCIWDSYTALGQLVATEEKFDVLARNYLELETDLLTLTAEHALVGYAEEFGRIGIRRTLNRRLMNVLSAARAYIDHMKSAVPRLFEKDSSQSTNFNTSFSASYNSSLGYRAMEALRNYSQHCGFPIHAVSLSHENLRNEPKNELRCGICILLRPALLAADKNFKASVLTELRPLGDRIDLKPLARDYVSCLAKIHMEFREAAQLKAETWSAVIESAVQKYLSLVPKQSSSVGLYAVQLDHPGDSERVPLFAGHGEYFRYLTNSNCHLEHAGFQYVTGRTIIKDA